MIVFKISYDTSVVADFAPTFNSGYTYTTKSSTSGTIKTVTYESDTAFTTIALPNNNRNCVKSVYIDLSGVTNVYNLCVSCQEMTKFIAVNATSKLNNLGQSTFDCTKLTHITYENCDLSGVTNIVNIFQTGARDAVTNATFKNVKFNNTSKQMITLLCKATTMKIEGCDFSSVTSCYQMFYNCVGLKGTLDLSMYDFTNVYETNYMFYGCTNLTKIIMPKGTFDKITNCANMFQECTSLLEVDLSGFHIPNAGNISYMFSGCIAMESIDLSALGVLNPTNINHMFVSCKNLKRANVSGIKLPTGLSYSHMFFDSTVVEWLDISNFLTPPTDTQNFWRSQTTIENVGMLYCPSSVINAIAPLLVNTGRTINIYYHDANLEELTVDSRFNYIYCDEYYGDVVETPDDLELYCNYHYDRNTKTSQPCYQDILDLTTGTITRKNVKVKLNDVIGNKVVEGSLKTINGVDMVHVRWNHYNTSANVFPVQVEGEVIGASATGIVLSASQGVYDGTWSTVNEIDHAYTNTNALFMYFNLSRFDGIDYTNATTITNWIKEQDFTLIIKIHNDSVYTEQLDIKPLKSYRNGSITTSSQQLTPTLTTTLPISNKFTTTNLTSGSTYNVYFNGTATKLDAGGTIITNPTSPCEVECGGTTLTIEGTDIQNVRVLETSIKNEVGSVCGTTDVELSKIITSDLEVITNGIEFNAGTMTNGNKYEIDNELGTINTKGSHSWGAGSFTSNKTYPKGFSLLHIEFDVYMPSDNLMAIINFNNSVTNNLYNFRDLTLNNDTATIAQGQQSVGSRYSSIVKKGHFSRLMYCFSSRGAIKLDINTGSSAMITASGNSAEGSTSGYTACANNGITISNFKIKVVENYPDATNSSQITSLLRTDSGLTVIWQDMNMSIGQSISKLEQPIKLRSLGTAYDSYNPITGELTKRIGVSETDGSYSVLSSPIVGQVMKVETLTNLFSTDFSLIVTNNNTKLDEDIITHKVGTDSYNHLFFNYSNLKPNTVYTAILNVIENNLIFTTSSDEYVISSYVVNNYHLNEINNKEVGYKIGETGIKTFVFITPDNTTLSNLTRNPFLITPYGKLTNQQTIKLKIGIVEGDYSYTNIPYFIDTETLTIPVYPHETPQLYTNGQVKVYSESDVYPTTVLNGQSTNNYAIQELNTSNNYTIRYDGTCESINLANKSNSQGTNNIVKSGATSGNLTFVNDSGDIDNVLLVEHDVRDQEINHFNGLQTVEVSKIKIFNTLYDEEFATEKKWIRGDNGQFDKGQTYVMNRQLNVDNYDKIYIKYSKTVNGGKTGTYPQVRVGCYKQDGTFINRQLINSETFATYNNSLSFPQGTYYIILSIDYDRGSGIYFEDLLISFYEIVGDTPRIETIDLPQPVQLNKIHKENTGYSRWYSALSQNVDMASGTAYDSYNPITGEYVQRVYRVVLNGEGDINYIDNWSGTMYCIDDNSLPFPRKFPYVDTIGLYAGLIDVDGIPYPSSQGFKNTEIMVGWLNLNCIAINLPRQYTNNVFNKNALKTWLRENPITLYYELETPIVTQLPPITIPTFEGGTLQLITTDGKVFPMVEYSMPTNNRYDTSSWEAGKVYTQRNMTEAYFNDSTTPMTPTETMTLTTDHISSGSIILNDNGNGLIVLKGNYTGRDIPYFTGMRSVESIEVEVTPSPDQPLFGKGGRK